jgi:hypothetical protein
MKECEDIFEVEPDVGIDEQHMCAVATQEFIYAIVTSSCDK